jgi:uncharacterized membrane protein YphA (DoxX/SURF4 family)
MTKIQPGRHVYALAAVMSGILIFAWRDFNAWRQILPLDRVPHPRIFLYIAAAIQLFAGVAIEWPPTRRIGAFSLAGIYFLFALLAVPDIIASPLRYQGWGSFFEQFSLVSAALVVAAAPGPDHQDRPSKLVRLGCLFFGVSVLSCAVEQLVYLSETAKLVPKWIPPGQMFWAIATTIAFALAALALLSGRFAPLASRLLTIMILGFALLVWLPILVSTPRQLFHWTETVLTLAIAGAAWIVADALAPNRQR